MLDEKLLLTEIKRCCSKEELFNAAKYINISYSIFSTDVQLWQEVKHAFGEKCNNIFERYIGEIIANRFINVLLLRYYPCERTVKYALVDILKERQETVLFELPVLNSRIDVCRINGNSYAYEIKTEFDSFKRLKKQVYDYSKVCEYVYLVTPESFCDAALKVIPEFCGLRVYRHNLETGKIFFRTKRKAKKSLNIDPNSQLQCLSQRSLYSLLANKKIRKIPSLKRDRILLVLDRYKPRTINIMFKRMVKQHYSANWKFIQQNYEAILPIDVQAFFSSPLNPKLLYLGND